MGISAFSSIFEEKNIGIESVFTTKAVERSIRFWDKKNKSGWKIKLAINSATKQLRHDVIESVNHRMSTYKKG